MQLSDYQVRALQRSLQQRESGPSITRSFRAAWKTYLMQMVFLGGLAAFWWWGGWRAGSMLVLGILLGCIFRDAVWYSLTKKMWPLSREITDWRRVEELLAQNTPRGPEPNKTMEPTR